MFVKRLNVKLFSMIFCGVVLGLSSINNASPLRVVTSTAELGDIAKAIGNNNVIVTPLVIKSVDIHHIEPKASMIITVSKADVVICNGLNLDSWMMSVISTSKNKKVMKGKKGFVDASVDISKLDVPLANSRITTSHKFGNPHYLLDPRNVLVVSKTIREAFIQNDPKHKDEYEKNYTKFVQNYQRVLQGWDKKVKHLNGKRAVTYHQDWQYFFNYAGMQSAGSIEPIPDVPPTPEQMMKIRTDIKKGLVNYIIISPFYSDKEAKILIQGSTVKLLSLPTSIEPGSLKNGSYVQMMETIINKLQD